ncbi:rod shape-determining protein MreD [Virgibacillus ainsalahensis]
MKRLYLPLILFLFLLLEGVALELLPSGLVMGDFIFVPHWVLIFLVFLAIYYDMEATYFSVLYALVFGLLIDVVYTGILGVYMFSYALVVYIIHGLRRMFHGNIFVAILLGVAGIVLADIFINIIYTVVGVSDILWKDYMMYRLLPTMLANLLFLLILYPIIVKRIVGWSEMQLSGRKSI